MFSSINRIKYHAAVLATAGGLAGGLVGPMTSDASADIWYGCDVSCQAIISVNNAGASGWTCDVAGTWGSDPSCTDIGGFSLPTSDPSTTAGLPGGHAY